MAQLFFFMEANKCLVFFCKLGFKRFSGEKTPMDFTIRQLPFCMEAFHVAQINHEGFESGLVWFITSLLNFIPEDFLITFSCWPKS